MADNVQLITRERHGSMRWNRLSDYRFAAQSNVAPVAAAELAKASNALPLGFVKAGDKLILAAILGLTKDFNLFVTPNGQWAGPYIPAAFRGYPFRLGQAADGQLALCIDEASGRVVFENEGGIPFFDEDGNPDAETTKFLQFLIATKASTELLRGAVDALFAKGVIEPWPLRVASGDQEVSVSGVSRVSEVALSKLSDADFLELRKAGALPVAYAQLMSMANISVLGQLAELQSKHRVQQVANGNGGYQLSDSGGLNFN